MVRSEWIQSISSERMAWILPGLNPVPPARKSPSEPRQSNPQPVVSPERFERSYGYAPLQPDGASRVWGVNSSAQLAVRGGAFSQDAAQQIGYHMPRLKGLGAALNSSLWAVIVGRDAIATVPGASVKGQAEYTRPDGVTTRGPQVLKNAASLSSPFRWQFVGHSQDPEPPEGILSGAMRYARHYASESGVVCVGPRAPFSAEGSRRMLQTIPHRVRTGRGCCISRSWGKWPVVARGALPAVRMSRGAPGPIRCFVERGGVRVPVRRLCICCRFAFGQPLRPVVVIG